MSFQHFRLGELALQQPLPPHLANPQQSNPSPPIPHQDHQSATHYAPQLDNSQNTFVSSNHQGPAAANVHASSSKQPYGSGDTDDGYTLVFPNLDAFNAWRMQEEERQMVEFVKASRNSSRYSGDTHGSKAVPPRFKDHTKLVCARHSRSGRKKYVKKHPERVRKVPSRKLEGIGCLASISYKTYYDTDEVRACYISQHSHEIGLANLPFTRRGRRAAVQEEKERAKKNKASDIIPPPGTSASTETRHETGSPAAPNTSSPAVAGPSTAIQPGPYTPTVPMMAPLTGQPQLQPSPYGYPTPQPYPPPFPPPPPPSTHPGFSHERWENMVTLFNSVREHARSFDYPSSSVAALETILIRMYLESPVGLTGQTAVGSGMQGAVVQSQRSPSSGMANHRMSSQGQLGGNSSVNEHTMDRGGGRGGSSDEDSP
ncbi:hypothetical protein AX16_000285 [Volvariella volvacea WC 439]|nr:hypothetical protein AX16_000285 [Volvariella volvacea WC 439]